MIGVDRQWRVEESTLCTEPQKTRASCNEMRSISDSLYMKRDSGEMDRQIRAELRLTSP